MAHVTVRFERHCISSKHLVHSVSKSTEKSAEGTGSFWEQIILHSLNERLTALNPTEMMQLRMLCIFMVSVFALFADMPAGECKVSI